MKLRNLFFALALILSAIIPASAQTPTPEATYKKIYGKNFNCLLEDNESVVSALSSGGMLTIDLKLPDVSLRGFWINEGKFFHLSSPEVPIAGDDSTQVLFLKTVLGCLQSDFKFPDLRSKFTHIAKVGYCCKDFANGKICIQDSVAVWQPKNQINPTEINFAEISPAGEVFFKKVNTKGQVMVLTSPPWWKPFMDNLSIWFGF